MADFTWKGYGWFKRDDNSGSPMFNGHYLPANITGPDGSDYVTLSITNPTGSVPYGAEIFTIDPGGSAFGYGTYTLVVGTRLDTLQSGVVFGGLFTYEDTTGTGNVSVTNNEIDVDETSDWAQGTGVNTSHNYFKNVSGTKTGVDDPYATSSDAVTTHVMKWEVGKLTFDSYVGTGTGGTNLKHTVATSNIPVPTGNEFVDINLWVFDDPSAPPAYNPNIISPVSVVLRNFSYAPLGISPSASLSPSASRSPSSSVSPSVSPSSSSSPSSSVSPSASASASISPSSSASHSVSPSASASASISPSASLSPSSSISPSSSNSMSPSASVSSSPSPSPGVDFAPIDNITITAQTDTVVIVKPLPTEVSIID